MIKKDITKEDLKELRRLFKIKKKLTRELLVLGQEFDKKIIEVFGIHYSNMDDEPLIDTLDYGTNSVDFETFINSMIDNSNNKEDADY